MYMRYLMDLVTMKKPKWYQFIKRMRNRQKISSAKYYIKTVQDINTDGELCNLVRDFMNTIEYMFLNGYRKDTIIPKYITTFKVTNIDDGNDFIIELTINGYTISITAKSYKNLCLSVTDLGIRIDYKSFRSIVPCSINLIPSSTQNLSLGDKEVLEIFMYIQNFIEVVMLHIIKEIIYLYQ